MAVYICVVHYQSIIKGRPIFPNGLIYLKSNQTLIYLYTQVTIRVKKIWNKILLTKKYFLYPKMLMYIFTETSEKNILKSIKPIIFAFLLYLFVRLVVSFFTLFIVISKCMHLLYKLTYSDYYWIVLPLFMLFYP